MGTDIQNARILACTQEQLIEMLLEGERLRAASDEDIPANRPEPKLTGFQKRVRDIRFYIGGRSRQSTWAG